jgi:hypothetical protein
MKKGRRRPASVLSYAQLSARRFEQPGDVLVNVYPEPRQHEDRTDEQIEPCDRPASQNAIDPIK